METLSKVNEQKDNVLAPSTTLSLSETLARGIRGKEESVGALKYTSVSPCVFFGVCSFLSWMGGFLGRFTADH